MPNTVDVVEIRAGIARLAGDLRVPAAAQGVVIFAHGSGSSRFSARNRSAAGSLHDRGFATLLLDLLTPQEESIDAHTSQYRADIERLSMRVGAAAQWTSSVPAIAGLPIGLFGNGTGTAAALLAAVDQPELIRAVVSRGGRPDLADGALPRVQAPTLLIVGSDDHSGLEINQQAMQRLRPPAALHVVPGATAQFAELGAFAEVERAAGEWFERYLT